MFQTYHPPFQSNPYYFNNLDKVLDTYSNFDRVLLAGDFNTGISENVIDTLLRNISSIQVFF